MIKRRAATAGLPSSTCCHTFRATGITAYLSNGATLERAQQIAAHTSPKTTKLYGSRVYTYRRWRRVQAAEHDRRRLDSVHPSAEESARITIVGKITPPTEIPPISEAQERAQAR